MAKIVVFEDSRVILDIIKVELAGHEIVGWGETLAEAFSVLGQLACGDLEADFVLVDGNLKVDEVDPVFRFASPSLTITPENNRLHVPLSAANRAEIRGSSYGQPGRGRDAKAIIDFMQLQNIITQTVGISADPMHYNGVRVDIDLTKDNLINLAATLQSSND